MRTIFAAAPRERLDWAIMYGAAHMRPIFIAVRDAGCCFGIISQSHDAFSLPTDRPTIAIVGDDMHEALGPNGFHHKSLQRLLQQCKAVAIVSCAPIIEAYSLTAATAAGLGRHVALIETRQEREADWMAFVKQHAPTASLLLATVKPMGRA